MPIATNGKNQVLDEVWNSAGGTFPAANLYISLHTGDPGLTGANECAGGSYARVQADFTAAAAGTLSNVAQVNVLAPSATGDGIVGWGAWSAASGGTFWWGGWLSTVSGLALVRSGDLATEDIQSVAHGLAANDRVAFESVEGLTVPAGLSVGTLYHVIAAGLTTDAFRVSTTSGGSAVNITAVGSAVWRKVVPQTTADGDTVRFDAGLLDVYVD